jgi:hypothetical protein
MKGKTTFLTKGFQKKNRENGTWTNEEKQRHHLEESFCINEMGTSWLTTGETKRWGKCATLTTTSTTLRVSSHLNCGGERRREERNSGSNIQRRRSTMLEERRRYRDWEGWRKKNKKGSLAWIPKVNTERGRRKRRGKVGLQLTAQTQC